MWEFKDGYFIETYDDRVMAKVDREGNLLGFHILAASSVRDKPVDVVLGEEPSEEDTG